MPHKNKEEQLEYAKKWYENNKEYKKEYVKRWRDKNREYVKKKAKEYMREYNKEYWHKIPQEKKDARRIVRNLLKSGKYKYYPCFMCGEKKTEFHHPDYNKPKEVVSVCRQCHHKIHSGDKPLLPSIVNNNYNHSNN